MAFTRVMYDTNQSVEYRLLSIRPTVSTSQHHKRAISLTSTNSVSLRLGKAFWSRGPAAICFQGFSSSAQTGPAAAPGNFPYLREIKPSPPSTTLSPSQKNTTSSSGDVYPQEDFGSLVQAYVELTQLMSNAHDVLYPNSARTRSLVV